MREVTVQVKVREFSSVSGKDRDLKANDTNRVTFPNGYPGAPVQVWGDTQHVFSELEGTFGQFP